ncbi:hypothetical protein [Paenibacillus sp. LPE1-1-1.1]|uniref:hypothetical protein n=1 Tax=Paenibacillus sp. LPE1-1-1.1 TaxID=3135230 RepID=UPI0034301DCF
MKRIADRTGKAVTQQSTSVQPFAGGILNKYKTSAGRNKFERAAMSHVLKSQPSITQQTLHIQVLAPKPAEPKQSSKKKALPSSERRTEQMIERERVTVEREKIVFRDVTHVIKEQRTIREIAMTQPAASDGTGKGKRSLTSTKLLEAKVQSSAKQLNKTVQSSKQQAEKSVDISNKQLKKAVQSINKQAEKNTVSSQKHRNENGQNSNKQTSGKSTERIIVQRDKINSSKGNSEKPLQGDSSPAKVKRELWQGTIPQTAGMPIKAWKAELQADYYKWLQARLQPGIVIQSIRRLEELRKPLAKERVQLLPATGKGSASRNSALRLTNARRAANRQEQPAEAVRQEAERSAATAGLEQREAAKRAEAVRQEAERSAATAGLEQREAAKRAEAVRQEAERSAAAAGLEQREAAKRAEAVRQEAERSAASAGLEQREAAKRAEAVRQEAERSAAAAGLEQREAAKRAEAVRREADKNAARASVNRRQGLEHRRDHKQEDEQVEATEKASVQGNELREGAAASHSATKAARSSIKPFETSIARQSGNWVITGSVADHNRIRLQLLTLQREPQSLADKAKHDAGTSSMAISAKRFIHRTQRGQAEQSIASDHSHTAVPSRPGGTNSVLPADKPSKVTATADGFPASRQQTNSGNNSNSSSKAANVPKDQAKQQGQLKNKMPEAAVTAYLKAGNIRFAAKPAQLILRRYEERLSQQIAEPRLSQLNLQSAADSLNRTAASEIRQLSGLSSKNAGENTAYRGRKAIVHRKTAASEMPRPEKGPGHSGAAAAKSAAKAPTKASTKAPTKAPTKASTKAVAEAKPFTKSQANMQTGVKTAPEAERQLAVRGQLLARESGKKTTLLRGALKLSHKRPETSGLTGNGMPHSKRAETALAARKNETASNGFGPASYHARRKTGRQSPEFVQSKIVPAERSIPEAGNQADPFKQAPALPNDVTSEPIQAAKAVLVQREDARTEPLIVRTALNGADTVQAADGRAEPPVPSQLLKAKAAAVQRQSLAALNRAASAGLVQRSMRGKARKSDSLETGSKALKRSAAAAGEAATRQFKRLEQQGAATAAAISSASMRAYPALSVQRNVFAGAAEASLEGGFSERTAAQPSSVSSSKAAGLNRLVQKAQPAAFSSRGMQAGSRLFQSIQRRSASARSAAAARVQYLTAMQGLTTVVHAGDAGPGSAAQTAGAANGQARLSYAAAAGSRSGIGGAPNQSSGDGGSFLFADRGGMPDLSHHKPKQAAVQEPPRQVKVEAPRELDPEKLQKMIMKIPQLRPEAIADQVYKALERKMKLEQRRRGY